MSCRMGLGRRNAVKMANMRKPARYRKESARGKAPSDLEYL